MKVLLCVIAKQETMYIPEYVKHYMHLGFDNIIFYDNNDKDDISQYNILKPYIDEGFVIYQNYRGLKGNDIQRGAYKHCIDNYKNDYNWIAFFDADEFLVLEEHKTIKEFINSNKNFNNFDGIMFNWLLMTDNDLLYHDEKPLMERFKTSFNNSKNNEIISKTIINTHGNLLDKVTSVHYPGVARKRLCTTDGLLYYNETVKENKRLSIKLYNKAYLKHFKFKTIEETFNRIDRGDCGPRKKYDNSIYNERIKWQLSDFFAINKFTDEKMQMIINRYPNAVNDILELLLKNKRINKETYKKYYQNINL